jgi:hypothetical protein
MSTRYFELLALICAAAAVVVLLAVVVWRALRGRHDDEE